MLTFKKIKKFIVVLGAAVIVGFFSALAINWHILNTSSSFVFEANENIASKQTVLILGARVYNDGRMSDILKDRVLTALELYNTKKVEKFLVSGDHGRIGYDEVNTIKAYLLENGVKPEDIFLDHAGFDTYDSIYRAKEIFQVKSLIIVTQRFHLPRAVYIAKSLHVDAIGVIADRHIYIMENYNQLRESLARVKAFVDVTIHSKPKFLGKPIPITGDSKLSWD